MKEVNYLEEDIARKEPKFQFKKLIKEAGMMITTRLNQLLAKT